MVSTESAEGWVSVDPEEGELWKENSQMAWHTLWIFYLGLEDVLLQQKSLAGAKHLKKCSFSDARAGQDSSGEEDSDDEEPNNSTIEVALAQCTLMDLNCS